MIILGGNMRYKACKEAGLKEVPVIITNLSEDKQREFLIKDNTSGGEWDWEVLANEWNSEELEAVSYTHLRAHETPEHLVCRLLLEKKKAPCSRLILKVQT